MRPRACFTTLGCKVNQYETQKILESFEGAGFEVVPFDSPAEVVVVNTCSVTETAESKSRYTLRRAARGSPEAKIVVTGCAAQMALNRGDEIPGVDLLVPNPEKLETLERLLEAFPHLAPPAGAFTKAPPFSGRTRATLKVQDGCSLMCSYCSIPFTRPGMRSRNWREVLEEARRLAEAGYREAVLTGVLIGSYGPESGSGGPSFEDLVRLLARESGLARLRISSIEIHQVTEPILELAAEGCVAPHFHVPLQSGSDGVLEDMHRRYVAGQYLELLERIRARVPQAQITTDVMVGFPTETPERFEESLETCRRAEFLKAHVFRFSPRSGTFAERWGDPIPDALKQERSRALQKAAIESGRRQARRNLGKTLRVLTETRARQDGLLQGLADNSLEVRFAGPDSALRQLVWVRADEEREGALYGEIVGGPTSEVLRQVPS